MKVILIFMLSFFLNETSSSYHQQLSKYNSKLFSINYPTSWDTTNQDNSVIFMAVEDQKNEKDFLKENLAIYVTQVDQRMTLEAAVESSKTAFKQEGRNTKDILEQGLRKNGKNIPYGLFKTRQLVKGHNIISTSVMFKKGTRMFIITFTHDNNEDAYYTSLYKLIIDSFELK